MSVEKYRTRSMITFHFSNKKYVIQVYELIQSKASLASVAGTSMNYFRRNTIKTQLPSFSKRLFNNKSRNRVQPAHLIILVSFD